MKKMTPITPTTVRYIKLGRGGMYARDAIDNGRLNFGYHSIDHNLCVANDWKGVATGLSSSPKSQGALSNGVREIREFSMTTVSGSHSQTNISTGLLPNRRFNFCLQSLTRRVAIA